MNDTTWSLPPSVEVLTREAATVVAIDDAVGVKDWYNFEDKVVT